MVTPEKVLPYVGYGGNWVKRVGLYHITYVAHIYCKGRLEFLQLYHHIDSKVTCRGCGQGPSVHKGAGRSPELHSGLAWVSSNTIAKGMFYMIAWILFSCKQLYQSHN